MSITRKDEARLLDAAERELVAPTHYPEICRLGLDELRSLRRLIRERRDRARDRSRQQRREMRGKAEPRAALEARDNTGTARKGEALAAALKRIGREIGRLEKLEGDAVRPGASAGTASPAADGRRGRRRRQQAVA